MSSPHAPLREAINAARDGLHRRLQPVLWLETGTFQALLLAGRGGTRRHSAQGWSAVNGYPLFHCPHPRQWPQYTRPEAAKYLSGGADAAGSAMPIRALSGKDARMP